MALPLVPPPFQNLPFAEVRGQWAYLSTTSIQFLQQMWTAILAQNQPVTTANLPSSPIVGETAFVTDCSLAAAGNFGATFTGGGSHHVPVFWDDQGGVWRIG